MKRITMAAIVSAFVLSLAGFGFAGQDSPAAMHERQSMCGNTSCCGGHSQMQKDATAAKQGAGSIFQKIQPSTEG